jgi:hypothetical protein
MKAPIEMLRVTHHFRSMTGMDIRTDSNRFSIFCKAPLKSPGKVQVETGRKNGYDDLLLTSLMKELQNARGDSKQKIYWCFEICAG